MRQLTDKNLNLKNQVILLRTDYNVPIKDGQIVDDFRIRASLSTIKYLLDHQVKKIIIISHLGRPEGKRDSSLSLKPIADHLKILLPEQNINFISDTSGPDVEKAVENLERQGIILLENLRFYSGEEANSQDFAEEIIESTHPDLFVQDGFAVVHRAHASTSSIPLQIPSVAGLLLIEEVNNLSKVLEYPKKPLLVIIGGSKVSDKQPLIDRFLPIADYIFIGGKISADGYLSSQEKIIVANDFHLDSQGLKLDIGPQSLNILQQLIEKSQTIIWNGVLGKVEDVEFSQSSKQTTLMLGGPQSQSKTTIICGGDTTAFAEQLLKSHPDLKFSLLSTGGGASLEFLSGLKLPGIEALIN